MKLRIFCLLAILNLLGNYSLAQDFLISFVGSGEVSAITTVDIENLNQGTKLRMNGTDILHLVNQTTGIEKAGQDLERYLTFSPNPITDYTIMQFYNPESGQTIIDLIDISGRRLLQTRDYLNQGIHAYRIINPPDGIYIVTIKSGRYNINGRFISVGSFNGSVKMIYENTTSSSVNPDISQKKEEMDIIKGQASETLMQYNSGDRLKITCISGNYRTVMIDIPDKSKIIICEFIECTDKDNNNYPVVKIGTQIWMAENLKTTRYLNGELTGTTSPATKNISEESIPGYQWAYEGIEINCEKYGRLYTWYSVIDSRGVCPSGWHLPDDQEWTTLSNFLGGEALAGSKLKGTGTSLWQSPNSDATNEVGFTALPGGVRAIDGFFSEAGRTGGWWSTTSLENENALLRKIDWDNNALIKMSSPKGGGFSVRCIKNPSGLNNDILPQTVLHFRQEGGTYNFNLKPGTDYELKPQQSPVPWLTYSLSDLNLFATVSYNPGSGSRYSYLALKDVNSLITDTLFIVQNGTGSQNIIAEPAFPGIEPTYETGSFLGRTVYLESFNGTLVYQGDILVGSQKAAFPQDVPKWEEGKVYWYHDGDHHGTACEEIKNAITNHYLNTNLKFIELVTREAIEKIPDKIKVITTDGNYSNLGKIGGTQILSLKEKAPQAIHELGHAIGLGHEHSRSDRDKYVYIAKDHILDSLLNTETGMEFLKDNLLDTFSIGNAHSEFDFESIMMYPSASKSYSRQENGEYLPVIYKKTINGLVDNYTLNTTELSAYDIETISKRYPELSKITPTVITYDNPDITSTSAKITGELIYMGKPSIFEYGICYSETSYPVITDAKVPIETGTGIFSVTLSYLIPDTRYYYRIYSRDADGYFYGNVQSFKTPETFLNINPQAIQTISRDGGQIQVLITSNSDWWVYSDQFWAKADALSGEGNKYISILVDPSFRDNWYSWERKATITFTSGYITKSLIINQEAGQISFLTPDHMTLNASSGSFNVKVNTPSKWKVKLGSAPEWVTINPSVGSGSSQITVSYPTFITDVPFLRNATITFITDEAQPHSLGNLGLTQCSSSTLPLNGDPTVAFALTKNFAVLYGSIFHEGGSPIIASGICYSTTPNPTTADNKTNEGSKAGSFTSVLMGLTPGTIYYARSYATNNAGTLYWNEIVFQTLSK